MPDAHAHAQGPLVVVAADPKAGPLPGTPITLRNVFQRSVRFLVSLPESDQFELVGVEEVDGNPSTRCTVKVAPQQTARFEVTCTKGKKQKNNIADKVVVSACDEYNQPIPGYSQVYHLSGELP